MFKILLILLSISALADIRLPVVIDNQSDLTFTMHYRNHHNMCSNYPLSIASNSQSTLIFCFPSSFWESGLDAKDYLEFASDETRIIFNAYVDIKNNNSNYTTLRIVDARMRSTNNQVTTIPYLDEKYTPILIESASAETGFAIQIKNKSKPPLLSPGAHQGDTDISDSE